MRSLLVGFVVSAFALLGAAHADGRRRRHQGADPTRLGDSRGVSIVNGCGSEGMQLVSGIKSRFMDTHTYGSNGYSFTVNFHDACNLHDAGYEGKFYVMVDGKLVEAPLVYDAILDQDVDYSQRSREWVDNHFLEDMRAQCDQQIVPQGDDDRAQQAWADAIDRCKNGPDPTASLDAWGAKSLWAVVRAWAGKSFKTLDHKRQNDGTSTCGNRGVYCSDAERNQ